MNPGTAPVPLLAPQYGPNTPQNQAPAPQTTPKNTTLKDYVPQSRLEGLPAGLMTEAAAQQAQVRVLHQSAESCGGAWRVPVIYSWRDGK